MVQFSTILVRVFTSNAQIPLPGIRVAIMQKQPDGLSALLASRMTDESGLTAPVRVAAPAAESTDPELSPSFAILEVLAQAPGFEPIRVEGIPLYPGQVTVQNLAMIPLPEFSIPGTLEQTVIIPPQEL